MDNQITLSRTRSLLRPAKDPQFIRQCFQEVLRPRWSTLAAAAAPPPRRPIPPYLLLRPFNNPRYLLAAIMFQAYVPDLLFMQECYGIRFN